jgi:hypothetical protein
VVHLDRQDNPLGHIRVDQTDADQAGTTEDPRVVSLVMKMDAAKLAVDITKRAAEKELRDAGIKFTGTVLLTAIAARKNRQSARRAAAESLADDGAVDA